MKIRLVSGQDNEGRMEVSVFVPAASNPVLRLTARQAIELANELLVWTLMEDPGEGEEPLEVEAVGW